MIGLLKLDGEARNFNFEDLNFLLIGDDLISIILALLTGHFVEISRVNVYFSLNTDDLIS